MSWNLNDSQLDQLQCSTCNNYISYGPVTQTPDDGYNCGRCCGNGVELNKFFEIFAKNCLFPCMYEINGCGAKIAYGDDALNHETLCKYRPSSCPISGGECGWDDIAVNTFFEHCLNEHKTHIVEDKVFKMSIILTKSLNTKRMMLINPDEVLLLHVLCNEEKGLSVNVKSFLLKSYKTILHYKLELHSLNTLREMKCMEKDITPFYCAEPDLAWIPFTTLVYMDVTALLLTVTVERDENTTVPVACDCCDEPFSHVNTLTCPKKHQFCCNCRSIDEQCLICNDSLQLVNGVSYACCNALTYECTFFSNSLLELEEHETKCGPNKCVVKTCQWSDIVDKLFDHLVTHTTAPNKIRIESENFKDSTYLIWLNASCTRPQNHIHNCGLFIVQISVISDATKVIKLVANYISSVGTKFIKGNIEVKCGKATHRGFIGKMDGSNIDESGEIRLFPSLLNRNEVVTIRLTAYELFCV